MKILCSECLAGVPCRYDGRDNKNEKLIRLAENDTLVTVCPEKLGGLLTPREPAEIRDGRVITKSGQDVTDNFMTGARLVLELCQSLGIIEAVLKQKSPSCGSGKIYDGTFSGKLIRGDGITTRLLKENGIQVISEEDL